MNPDHTSWRGYLTGNGPATLGRLGRRTHTPGNGPAVDNAVGGEVGDQCLGFPLLVLPTPRNQVHIHEKTGVEHQYTDLIVSSVTPVRDAVYSTSGSGSGSSPSSWGMHPHRRDSSLGHVVAFVTSCGALFVAVIFAAGSAQQQRAQQAC